MNGDHARAAQLLASLSDAQPGQVEIARKALSEALGAGRIELALRLARSVPPASLATDARLLLVGEEIKREHAERALVLLDRPAETGDLTFLDPLVRAWSAADRGDAAQALTALDTVPPKSLLSSVLDQEHALILLKFRRTAEAEPYARRAVGSAGGREQRLRLALADGFLSAGDRPRALMIVEGMGEGEVAARQRILAGKSAGLAIDSLPKAFAEVLTAFSIDLSRMARTAPPIGLIQVARYANPQDSSITALLALVLAEQNRTDEAVALLRTAPANGPQAAQIRDVETRVFINAKRMNDAYGVAATAAATAAADSADYLRLGDVLQAMNRHSEAADAYSRAVALARSQNLRGELTNLLFLQAGALEEAKRWPEAKVALQQALTIAPDQPALLNFLGYAELERGENVDSAEAMIRKASELAPDDASITDSLGWAEFKRGKVDQAIATLQQAAEKDPQQSEIQEHLGDALYRSGRRYEARFAWSAALATAEDATVNRLKAKLASGLTSANAAP